MGIDYFFDVSKEIELPFLEDLGDGIFGVELRRPEREYTEAAEADNDSVFLDDTEGIYLSCRETDDPLAASLGMVLQRFNLDPENALRAELSIAEIQQACQKMGIETELCQEADADTLLEALEQGVSPVCFINRYALNPASGPEAELLGAAAVNVRGIDFEDPFQVNVMLDDPCAGVGGTIIELSDFMRAWDWYGRIALLLEYRGRV